MKKNLIILLSICHICYCNGQDFTNMEKLLETSENAIKHNPKSARRLIKNGILLSKETGSIIDERKFHNLLGRYLLRQSEIDSAQQIFRLNLHLSRKLSNEKLEIVSLNNLGLIKRTVNDLDSALYYYERSKKIEERIENFKGVSQSLLNISVIHSKKGDYVKSIQALQKTLQLIDRYSIDPDDQIKAGVQMNLGINFFMIDDHEMALNYYQKSYSLLINNGQDRNLVFCIDGITHLLEIKGDLDEIPSFLRELDRRADKAGHPELLVIAKNARANFEFARKNFNNSFDLALEGIKLSNESNIQNHLASLNKNLAKSMFELGYYKEAIDYFLIAIKEGKNSKRKRFIIDMKRLLSECYIRMNQHDLAYKYLKQSIDLQDSLIPEEKKKTMQRLEVQFQTKLLKKDNEIQRGKLKAKNRLIKSKDQISKRNQWLAILGLVVALITLALLIWIVKSRKIIKEKNLKLGKQSEKLDNKVKELELTQNQLNIRQKRAQKQLERTLKVSTIRQNIKDADEKSKTEYIALKEIVKITRGKGEPTNGVGEGSLRLDVYLGNGFKLKYSKALSSFLKDFGLEELDFVKIDSGTILNMHYIDSVDQDNGKVYLRVQEFSPESRKYKIINEEILLKPRSNSFNNFLETFNDFQILRSKLTTL